MNRDTENIVQTFYFMNIIILKGCGKHTCTYIIGNIVKGLETHRNRATCTCYFAHCRPQQAYVNTVKRKKKLTLKRLFLHTVRG